MQLDLPQLKGGLPEFKSFASALNGLGADNRYALAVSGGPDSIAMLILFAQWRAQVGWESSDAGGRDVVLSVDHQLRPHSVLECKAVADLAANLGFAHQTLKWQHQGVDSGVQAKARAARYQLLDKAASKARARYLLLAHTRDDQAETVLMRLMRGSGVDGLSAIHGQKKRNDMFTTMVRPLLDVPKAQLLGFLNTNAIAYASDPSNEDMAYERVRLRKFLDVMELNEPHIKPRIAVTAMRMGRAAEALEHYTTQFFENHASQTSAGSLKLDLRVYKALPREVRLRVIKRIILRLGHGDMPQEASLEVIEMMVGGAGNAATLCGWQFRTAGEQLSVEREIARFTPAPISLTECADYIWWDKRFGVHYENVSPEEIAFFDRYQPVLEAVGDRWAEVKALYKLESTHGLSDLERTALPCLTSNGRIFHVPAFEANEEKTPIGIRHKPLEGCF